MADARPAVLVVDDDAINTEMLARRLTRQHFDVEVATSGACALERLKRRRYQAVLLDIMMPGIDGLEVLKRLRAGSRNSNTPVIMVTAKCDGADVERAFCLGADDFIQKPIDFRVLLARLNSQVARDRAQSALRRLNQRLNETVEARTRHLLEAQSLLTSVSENLPVVIWRLEADEQQVYRLTFLHGHVGKVLDDRAPQLGTDLEALLSLVHPDDVELVRRALKGLVGSGVPISLDTRLFRPGESHRWAHLAAHFNGTGSEGCIDGILIDIHSRKLLESQVMQSQKLESVGQLASGIAHEVNSPAQYTRDNIAFVKESFADLLALVAKQDELLRTLSVVELPRYGELETLRKQADLDFRIEEIPAALEQSLDGIDRISRIVNAMKAFTHPGGEEPELCDLNRLIEDTTTIARNEWKYVAELELDLAPSMPFVSCHASELGQAVLNLIVNSAHAIAEARQGQAAKGHIRVSSRHDSRNGWVEICVADDGPGVPEQLRNRIFDPFFTTKAVGKGTGQGLAIARSAIVDKHNGQLTLDESVSQGACFVIRIPLEVGERT